MTVKQAATELGISDSLVYALCSEGKIRHERHGLGRGTIRITREALDEYRLSRTIEERKEASVPPEPKVKPQAFEHLKL